MQVYRIMFTNLIENYHKKLFCYMYSYYFARPHELQRFNFNCAEIKDVCPLVCYSMYWVTVKNCQPSQRIWWWYILFVHFLHSGIGHIWKFYIMYYGMSLLQMIAVLIVCNLKPCDYLQSCWIQAYFIATIPDKAKLATHPQKLKQWMVGFETKI